MKLIVGLGNPGEKYDLTRHNVGFMAVDEFAKEAAGKLSFKHHLKTHAQILKIPGANGIILAKPQTYMNHSGRAIRALKSYFRIENDNILVIYDEYALPFGSIRTRQQGSDGGHNGVISTIKYIGPRFARIRVGISNGSSAPMEKFVLSRFNQTEQDKLPEIFKITSGCINDFVNSQLQVDTRQINRE